jgi:transposase-like protein
MPDPTPPPTVQDLIDRRGGYRAVARALGVPPTTVHSWRRVNRLPHWRRDALLALPLVAATGDAAPARPDGTA